MATIVFVPYTWQQGDTLRRLAGRKLAETGYTSAHDLAEDIRTYNLPGNVPTGANGLIDWVSGPAIDQVIVIPHIS